MGLLLVLTYNIVLWSLMPGKGSTLFISVSLLLRKMASVFEHIAGNHSIHSKLRSWNVVRNASMVDFVLLRPES